MRADDTFVDPLSGEELIPFEPVWRRSAWLRSCLRSRWVTKDATWDDVLRAVEDAKPLALSPDVPASLDDWIDGRSYPELFREAFGDAEVTVARIAMAVASYERTLISDQRQSSSTATIPSR